MAAPLPLKYGHFEGDITNSGKGESFAELMLSFSMPDYVKIVEMIKPIRSELRICNEE